MSRFAIDPRWLLLPAADDEPGGDLVARRTCSSIRTQAFEAYRADGVDAVVCEEKHMGSRAVVLVCRRRDGRHVPGSASPATRSGAVWTRTGPAVLRARAHRASCVDARARRPPSGRAVRRARHVVAAARRRAAAVEREGRSSCCATSTPRSARPPGRRCRRRSACSSRRAAAGLDVARAARPHARARGERRRRSPPPTGATAGTTDGLDGVRLAPFQLLAAEGAASPRPAARLAPRRWPTGSSAPTPALIAPTRRRRGRHHRPGLGRAPATHGGSELTGGRRRGHGRQAGRQPRPAARRGSCSPG